MSSAYVFQKTRAIVDLPRLPIQTTTKYGLNITIDRANPTTDITEAQAILNEIIEEGQTYPFETPLSQDDFRAYFLSHEAFVAKSAATEVVGIFYIKPNFPGRCSHICNGGFCVPLRHRCQGVARAMAETFFLLARDLGYRGVMFNLVFVTNVASLALWRSVGMQELGTIPKVGRLKDLGYQDAIQFYRDLTKEES